MLKTLHEFMLDSRKSVDPAHFWWEMLEFDFLEVYRARLKHDWSDQRAVQWYNELWYVHEGQCRVQINGRSAVAQAGDVVLLPFGTLRHTSNLSSMPIVKTGMSFHLRMGARQDVVSLFNLPLCLSSDNSAIVVLLEKLVDEMVQKPIGYNFVAQSVAQLTLFEFVRAARPKTENFREFEQDVIHNLHQELSNDMMLALRFIEKNYRDKSLRVEDLAAAVHLSVSYFSRKFKTELKMAPMEYLRLRRLDAAYPLVLTSEDNIAQIAHGVGFDDPSHFGRLFKARFGVTPREARNRASKTPHSAS